VALFDINLNPDLAGDFLDKLQQDDYRQRLLNSEQRDEALAECGIVLPPDVASTIQSLPTVDFVQKLQDLETQEEVNELLVPLDKTAPGCCLTGIALLLWELEKLLGGGLTGDA